MAKTVIESLVTQLGFDFDDKALVSFNNGMKKTVTVLGAVVTSALGAEAGIIAFIKNVAKVNDKIYKLSQITGVGLEAMQELGYVAELNGSSVETMNSTLANLSRITSEAARGVGSGVEAFGILGMSAVDAGGNVKSADTVLTELADSLKGVATQAQRIELAEKLGVSGELLLAIQNGSDALNKQRQEARELNFAIGKDAGKAAARFISSMTRIQRLLLGVKNFIGTKLLKEINPMIETFVSWFITNQKIVTQHLEKYLTKLHTASKFVLNIFFRIVTVVDTIAQAMGGWKNTIIAVTGVLVALNAAALITPIVIAGIIVALFLLIEDLQKFAQGGDSAIGQFAAKWPELDAAIRTTLDLFKMVIEGWGLLLTKGGEAFEGFKMWLADITSVVTDFYDVIIEKIKAVSDVISNQFSGALAVLNKIPGFSAAMNVVHSLAVNPVPALATAPALAAGGVRNISNVTNNTTNQGARPNIAININGGDITKVRETVDNVLREHYTSAGTNLSSEVEH